MQLLLEPIIIWCFSIDGETRFKLTLLNEGRTLQIEDCVIVCEAWAKQV